MNIKKRFKNYGLWVAIFSLIPLVLQGFGIKVFETYSEVINAILTILVTAGILNNPATETKGFSDDKHING